MAIKYATVNIITDMHYDRENKTWVQEKLYNTPYCITRTDKKNGKARSFDWPKNSINIRVDTELKKSE